MRTQIGIVGAGPAGLLLSHLLHRDGIDSVVLEIRSRDYVEKRIRAGVLEQATAELMSETGVGERLRRDGLVHHGIELRFDGRGHRIALSELTGGRTITIYGQQEVVKDLIAARLAAGGTVLFEAEDVSLHDVDSVSPSIRFRRNGEAEELQCDLIAGCDGFHGVCRPSIPHGVLTVLEHEFPYGWLGILAAVAPSTDELIYANHEQGFALHSLRSPTLTRLYLQCDPNDDLADWPDERVWEELRIRLATDCAWTLREGPVVDKAISALRSFVVEPMQWGRLYLAGDAAHIVPPTGAKGLNLAVADVRRLAEGIRHFYRSGQTGLLDRYSDGCLNRVWRAQQFASWMTWLMHRPNDEPDLTRLFQLAELRWVASSRAAATSLAENYVGLPHG